MNPVPWIPFTAREFLEPYLHSEMRVFEWGSGGSTLWFAQRTKHVTTVEHWDRYHNLLMKDLQDHDIENVAVHFIVAEQGRIHAHLDVDHPDNYFGHLYDQNYDQYNFRTYVEIINQFSVHHFDIVFIDGQARSACLKHGRSRVKPGGFLIFDNSDRKRHFRFAQDYFNSWEPHVFLGRGPDYGGTGSPWECTIWRKIQDG